MGRTNDDEEAGFDMSSGRNTVYGQVPSNESGAATYESPTKTTAPTQNTDESLLSPQTIISIVGSIVTSVAIVMVNKLVMNNGFPFASTLTALHQLTGFCFSSFLIFAKFIPKLPEPLPEYASTRYYIAGLYSSGLVLMNQSLAMNPVAFYQLLKMACIPAIAILQFVLFKKILPRATVIALAVILLGVAISTLSPTTPVKTPNPTRTRRRDSPDTVDNNGGIVAFFMGILTLLVSLGAVFTTALSQIELNQSPDLKRLSSFQSMNALSLISFGVCMTAATFVDMKITLKDLITFNVFHKLAAFWAVVVKEAPVGWILASCAMAILVNLFGFMLIKGTSAITFQVVGHLKTVLTLAMGAFLFGSAGLDGMKGLGVVVALVGMVLYSREKL
ncbi:triose-phosphate transporter family-domain-containing protein [Chytriomyces cf. hyalinus JEL632]|nr:triose-phosphate transporter family-domain-containing protein [Chytriomyces cf. hyalinus JEL632]